MTLRDKRQAEFAKIATEKGSGILHLCPRFGKIKTCFNFIKPEDSVLVVYPKMPIKQSWLDDSIRWNFSLKNFTFTTTASVHKYQTKKYDWVIWDEPQEVMSDKVLTAMNVLCIQNKVIALSGSIGQWTEKKIKRWTRLNIIANYSTKQGIKEKVITDYEIFVVPTTLDKKLRGKYWWFSKTIDELEKLVGELKDQNQDIFSEERQIGRLRIARMQLLHKSKNKLLKTKLLLDKFKDKRLIAFTHLTEFADKLGIPRYHSKHKIKQELEDFKAGKIKQMVTLDMISAGITFQNLNLAIISTFNSNSEELYQKVNRITAQEMDNPDKKAQVYIIYLKNTQEEKWLDKALEMFDRSKIRYL